MTREELAKAIYALKISAPVMAVTQEEFNDYIMRAIDADRLQKQFDKMGRYDLLPPCERK